MIYKNLKKAFALMGILSFLVSACGMAQNQNSASTQEAAGGDTSENFDEYNNVDTEDNSQNADLTPSVPEWTAISEGDTLATRINVPEGFERVEVEAGGFADYLRSYEMKPDGSNVLLYDGSPKGNQSDHVAVFALPIEDRDLQQCADSIMRMYGEYYYSIGAYDKIKFPMGGGFTGDFSKWVQGYTISLSGNSLCWSASSSSDASYDSFVKFMNLVFAYSGTLNMEETSEKISLEDAQIGDIFIKGGSPGHVVMIVDMCENTAGDKAYLLGQGYMPAQEFHVIKNPLHEEDPWYYQSEITYPFYTAEYTFPEESLARPMFCN